MSAPRTLLALVALAGCAHAPWNPYGGWSVVRTKHITMYTDTKFLHSTTLESLELAYSALWSSLFQGRGIAPVEVLFLEEPQFVAAFGHYRPRGVTIAKLPGRGQLGRRGLLVIGENSFVPAAAHRLAHLFLHAMAPKAPLWVHEAYATYVETLEYRADAQSQMACLGQVPGSNQAVTLEELFSWTWRQYDDSQKADWYRFTARSLLDYFLAGEKGTLRPQFAELMEAVTTGTDARQAVAKLYSGISVPELEKRMMDHRKSSELIDQSGDSGVKMRGLCPLRFTIVPQRAADRAAPRVEPLEKQDVERLMERLWMLPRRAGYVDWYPPEVITLEGYNRS